jgi:Flp pilus assembly protein TadD
LVFKAASAFAFALALTFSVAGRPASAEKVPTDKLPADKAHPTANKSANPEKSATAALSSETPHDSIAQSITIRSLTKTRGPKELPAKRDEIRKQAKFHTTRREFTEALPLWAELAQKPDAEAEAYLGWSHLQMGDKASALQHLNKSIALNPRTIEGHRYLGYYLIGEGKVPEAVKAFRTSMSFDPHHKCNCGDLEKLVLSKSKHRRP